LKDTSTLAPGFPSASTKTITFLLHVGIGKTDRKRALGQASQTRQNGYAPSAHKTIFQTGILNR
jgi:hypothetical protein